MGAQDCRPQVASYLQIEPTAFACEGSNLHQIVPICGPHAQKHGVGVVSFILMFQ